MTLLRKILVIVVVSLVIISAYLYIHCTGAVVETAAFAANIATVIALTFLAFEIRDSTKTRHLEGGIRLFEMLNNPNARKGRQAIYSALVNNRELKKDDIEYAEKIRADFNEIGIMVKEGLFPRKIALRMYSDTAIRCWEALRKHIEKQREDRGTPFFMEDFEWFYNQSKRYREKNYPEEKRRIFNQT